MSSSLYMLLFVVAALPSLVMAFIQLYTKKPVELYKKEISYENSISCNQALALNSQQLVISNNELRSKPASSVPPITRRTVKQLVV